MSDSGLFIGLISGTSVDGIDCALVDLSGQLPTLVDTHFVRFDPDLREAVLSLCEGRAVDLAALGATHVRLGREFGQAALTLLEKTGTESNQIVAIGSHGQTVWHQPDGDYPFTLQLADPNTIAQITGITTVGDLRGRDMAAGGQGAPLAPLLHREMFHSANVDRAVVNIGGISNITVLPRSGRCLAFDTGPGNVLMDYWVEKHQSKPYDKGGAWAASGQFSLTLLNALFDEEYFSRPIPKSTGRELFNGAWLETRISKAGVNLKPEDVQATLLTFTVTTIVSELSRHCSPSELYICGGGAHNDTLMSELGKVASDYSVSSTSDLGVDPDWVEAMAFAWLGKLALEGKPVVTEDFTGAKGAVPLGAIYRAI
jgi:anhydro-N-acetylmuramic acid kinase